MEWGVTPHACDGSPRSNHPSPVTRENLVELAAGLGPRGVPTVPLWKQRIAAEGGPGTPSPEGERVGWSIASPHAPQWHAARSATLQRKQEGDAAYRAGGFASSAKVYTDGLADAVEDEASMHLRHVLYVNRAASHLALKNYALALSDAQQAADLRASYTRAHVVKSLALLGQDSQETAFTSLLTALAGCKPNDTEWGYVYSTLHKAQPLPDTIPDALAALRNPDLPLAPRYLIAALHHVLHLLAENDVDYTRIPVDSRRPSETLAEMELSAFECSASGAPGDGDGDASSANGDEDGISGVAVSVTSENLRKMTFAGVHGHNPAGPSRDPTLLHTAPYAERRTLHGRLKTFYAHEGPAVIRSWRVCAGITDAGTAEAVDTLVEHILRTATLYHVQADRLQEHLIVPPTGAQGGVEEGLTAACGDAASNGPGERGPEGGGNAQPSLFEDPVLAVARGAGRGSHKPAHKSPRGGTAGDKNADANEGPYRNPLHNGGGAGVCFVEAQAAGGDDARDGAGGEGRGAEGAIDIPPAAHEGWRTYKDGNGRTFHFHRATGVSARERSPRVLARVARALAAAERKNAAPLSQGGRVDRVDDHTDDATSLSQLGWRTKGGRDLGGGPGVGGAKSTYYTSSTRGGDEMPETDAEVVAALASGEWVVVRHIRTGLKFFYNPQTKSSAKDLKAELERIRTRRAAVDKAAAASALPPVVPPPAEVSHGSGIPSSLAGMLVVPDLKELQQAQREEHDPDGHGRAQEGDTRKCEQAPGGGVENESVNALRLTLPAIVLDKIPPRAAGGDSHVEAAPEQPPVPETAAVDAVDAVDAAFMPPVVPGTASGVGVRMRVGNRQQETDGSMGTMLTDTEGAADAVNSLRDLVFPDAADPDPAAAHMEAHAAAPVPPAAGDFGKLPSGVLQEMMLLRSVSEQDLAEDVPQPRHHSSLDGDAPRVVSGGGATAAAVPLPGVVEAPGVGGGVGGAVHYDPNPAAATAPVEEEVVVPAGGRFDDPVLEHLVLLKDQAVADRDIEGIQRVAIDIAERLRQLQTDAGGSLPHEAAADGAREPHQQLPYDFVVDAPAAEQQHLEVTPPHGVVDAPLVTVPAPAAAPSGVEEEVSDGEQERTGGLDVHANPILPAAMPPPGYCDSTARAVDPDARGGGVDETAPAPASAPSRRTAGKSPDPLFDDLVAWKDRAMEACDYAGVVEAARRIAEHVRDTGEASRGGGATPPRTLPPPYSATYRPTAAAAAMGEVWGDDPTAHTTEGDVPSAFLPPPPSGGRDGAELPSTPPGAVPSGSGTDAHASAPAATGSLADTDPILLHLLEEREQALTDGGRLQDVGLLSAQIQERMQFLTEHEAAIKAMDAHEGGAARGPEPTAAAAPGTPLSLATPTQPPDDQYYKLSPAHTRNDTAMTFGALTATTGEHDASFQADRLSSGSAGATDGAEGGHRYPGQAAGGALDVASSATSVHPATGVETGETTVAVVADAPGDDGGDGSMQSDGNASSSLSVGMLSSRMASVYSKAGVSHMGRSGELPQKPHADRIGSILKAHPQLLGSLQSERKQSSRSLRERAAIRQLSGSTSIAALAQPSALRQETERRLTARPASLDDIRRGTAEVSYVIRKLNTSSSRNAST